MVNSHNTPVEINQQVLHDSRNLWGSFTKMIVVTIVAVVVILGLMGLFLL